MEYYPPSNALLNLLNRYSLCNYYPITVFVYFKYKQDKYIYA